MIRNELQVWGDSILKGVVYDEARRRYTIVKDSAVNVLSSLLPVPVRNCSRMARTAPEALEAMKSETGSWDGSLILMEFGGNDCDFDWKAVAERPEAEHVCRTPAGEFAETMGKMIRLVRDRGGIPVLATLPPLDAARYFDWITRDGTSRDNIMKYLGVTNRIYWWQEYYSSLVSRIAAEFGCACAPIREFFLKNVKDDDIWCLDGIHPNARGQKLMVAPILQTVNRILENGLENANRKGVYCFRG